MATHSCVICDGEVQRTPSNGRYPKTCSPTCRRTYQRQVNPSYQRREIPTEKLCTRCGEVKPLTLEFFPPSKQRHIGGFYPYCRPCNRRKRDKWGLEHPDREWLSDRVDRFKRDALERGSPEIKFSTADFLRMFHTQSGKCGYCTVSIELRGLHVDHVLPVVRGGATVVANLIMTCADCNLRKGKSTITEWVARGAPEGVSP